MSGLRLSSNLLRNQRIIEDKLNYKSSYDVIYRQLRVFDTDLALYAINGLTDSKIMSSIIHGIINISKHTDKVLFQHRQIGNIVETNLSHMQIQKTNNLELLMNSILSGNLAILIENNDEAFIVSANGHPARTPEEAPNEPSIRGCKDGFIESVVSNTALVRRRIRHESLKMEKLILGDLSHTDVIICYLEGYADKRIVDEVRRTLLETKVNDLSMGSVALLEILFPNKRNPLPYAKITERPDVFSAEITKGYIGILVDNCPNGLILPVSFFDFTTNVEEFQNSPFAASIYRLFKLIFVFLLLFIIPAWYYLALNPSKIPQSLDFLKVSEEYKVPVYLQLLVLFLIYRTLTVTYFTSPGIYRGALSITISIIISSAGFESKLLSPHVILFVLVNYLMSKTMFTNEIQASFTTFELLRLITTITHR